MNRNDIFDRLRTAPLQITFRKNDGTKRTILASLQDGLLVDENKKELLAQRTNTTTILNVFSILDGGIRQINAKRIEPNGVREIDTTTMRPVRANARRSTVTAVAAKKAPAKRGKTTAAPAEKRVVRAVRRSATQR